MSISILLIQNDNISDEIRFLLQSKFSNMSLAVISGDNFLNEPNIQGHQLLIAQDRVLAEKIQTLAGPNQTVIHWQGLPELSEKIDVHLQLSRYHEIYPLALKNWEITEVLHNGKDAIIYKAHDAEGRQAAIKRFKFKSHQLKKVAIRQFLDGVVKQCNIQSQRLVRYYDGGISNHVFYLVMEYLEHGTLRQSLNSCGEVLPTTHALQWFEEIVLALDVVHSAGLIHRDLKIDNIMLRDDGSLALTDFGVSKKILLDAGIIHEDELHCSPHYVSPEQISGEPCTTASDIYSLGVIFYELLTGKKPYVANQAHELMMHHLMAPVPQLPEKLYKYQPVLEKLMAKNPDDRFKSALEAIQFLRVAA